MEKLESAQEVKNLLQQGGFYVSEYCKSGTFDLIARRAEFLLIIKILFNIDAASGSVMNELRVLSSVLGGAPLIVGEKSSSSKIKSGTIYLRYRVPIMSKKTFSEFILEDIEPCVYASPGGFYVHVDSEKIKKIRAEKRISLGEVARAIGMSRRAVQLYEQGMSPSLSTALKLEKFFKEKLILPTNVLTLSLEPGPVKLDLESHVLFRKQVFKNLNKLGYEVIPTIASPFDALAKNKKDVLITCVSKRESSLAKKINLIASISKVARHKCVFFVERAEKQAIQGIPIVVWKELMEMRTSEEFIELILERRLENELPL